MTEPDYRYRDGLTGRWIKAKRAAKLSARRVIRVLVGRKRKRGTKNA